jgi:metal-responsive CopG/Arc/MetJ family transcriptional regulator
LDTHTMQCRLPKKLWERFRSACQANDTNPSEAVREFMRMFVRQEAEVRGLVDQAEEEYQSRFASPSVIAQSLHKEKHMDSKVLWREDTN